MLYITHRLEADGNFAIKIDQFKKSAEKKLQDVNLFFK
jgi:hypothetical protein